MPHASESNAKISPRKTKNRRPPRRRRRARALDLELDLGLRELDLLTHQGRGVLGDAVDDVPERTRSTSCTPFVLISRQGASGSWRAGSRPRMQQPSSTSGRSAAGSSGVVEPNPFTERPCSSAALMISHLAVVVTLIRADPRRIPAARSMAATRFAAIAARAPIPAIKPLHMRRFARSLSPPTRRSNSRGKGRSFVRFVCPFSRPGKRMPRRNRPRRGTEARRGAV